VDSQVNEALGSFKHALSTLDEILSSARGPVREVLGDLKSAARNAADVTRELAGVGPDARKLIAGLGVDLDSLMRNLVDTSRNLQDTSEDVRAHPWKLLTKPDDRQIAFENLRAAALNYMRAMRDLNDTSRRLIGLMGRTDLDEPEVRALLDRAVKEFQAAQDRYQRDEARWQRLFQEAGARK
jgi:ABC-type transporter Mla subunit MlaD